MDSVVLHHQTPKYIVGYKCLHYAYTHAVHRLAAVNFLLGCVGITQVTRILLYRRSLRNGSITEAVDDDVQDLAHTAEGVAKEAVAKVKSAVKS